MIATAAPARAAPSPRVRHLLAAARTAFIAHGYGGVSIDALARESGVSKETIYRHFADKQALFRAALNELAADFAERAAALRAAAPSPGVELEGLARAVLDAAVEGGLLSPLRLAAGVAGTMPDFAAELQAWQWARMEPVRQVLETHARRRGVLAAVPLSLALDFGSLAVDGPALLMGFAPPPPEERARMAAQVAALFGQGVLGAASLKGACVADRGPMPPLGSTPPVPPAAHIRTLLDVAARHFLETGFEGASLLEIGAEARVGRGTLYRHFGSKAGLFAAVLHDMAATVAAEAQVPPLPPNPMDAAATEQGLAHFAAAALANLGGPRSLALHRAAIAAAPRDPALARAVHDLARAPWTRPLEAWLASALGIADPHRMARALLVMALQGNRLFSAGRVLSGEAAAAHVQRMARIFLRGYAHALACESPGHA